MAKLTDKQKRFVEEYLVDLNATQAAIRADYSEKTARSQGQRLLTKVDVQKAIQKGKSERSERVKVDADYVLGRLVEIDQMDFVDILNDSHGLKPVAEWPAIWRCYISSMEVVEEFQGSGNDREMIGYLKKIKWPDKLKNLELLGKHVDVQAFSEKKTVEHSGKVDYSNMTEVELDKRISELQEKSAK